MNASNKEVLVGRDWFHRHPKMEYKLGVDEQHVIIDEPEYRQVVDYLSRNPKIVDEIRLINLWGKNERKQTVDRSV